MQSNNILENICHLTENNVIQLQWIPAHCGLTGNEEADRLAKEGSGKPQSQFKLSYREAKALVKNRFHSLWKERTNSKYHADNISGLTRKQQTTIFRLRTGHCRLNAHMHKINLSTSPACPCGTGIQNPQHILMECPTHLQARNRIWAQRVTLEEKLWGSLDDLCKTAAFMEATGLCI